MDLAAVRAKFEEHKVRTGHEVRKVKVGGFDVDGVLRGKYVSVEKFHAIAESGFGFCDVVFGWDISDALYDNAEVTGWSTGYPDAHAVIDLSTLRFPPGEPDTAVFLVDFTDGKGGPHPACPRSLLRGVVAKAAAMGFTATFACELEFWCYRETPESLHQKDFRGLTPLSRGMFGYSWVREDQHRDLCHAIMDELRAFDVPIEALHTETGPGVYEVALRYDDVLRAADKAALFKTYMKGLAARHGVAVTFMAKVSANLPGSSGHIHQSLWTIPSPGKEAENAFYGSSGSLSSTALHYVAGQLALMPELTALYAPTINAYKRYVPGVWAPTDASWGVENRTTAIRAIPGGPSSARLEFRQTAADLNPYVAMAASLASGLYGIERKLPTPQETKGAPTGTGPALPRTLEEATARLAASAAGKEILGEAFVNHYVRTREWEVRQYHQAVTDWELRRYFEAI